MSDGRRPRTWPIARCERWDAPNVKNLPYFHTQELIRPVCKVATAPFVSPNKNVLEILPTEHQPCANGSVTTW